MEFGPLLALAGLVIGILGAEHVEPGSATTAMVAGGIGLLCAWLVTGRARTAIATIALAVLGGALMSRALDGQVHSPLAGAIEQRTVVTLGGVVVDDPQSAAFMTSALVRVRARPDSPTRLVVASAGGDIAGRLRALQAGDRIVLRGRLGPLRPTTFDARFRWRHAAARVDETEVLGLAQARGLVGAANAMRAEVLRGMTGLAPANRALLAGFLLGDTRAVPAPIVLAYRDSGLSHLLAVSGENVAFTLALVAPVLRRLPLGARTCAALALVAVFAAMTRFEPSVLRASAMATIALASTFLGRPPSPTRLLALAVIGLLLCDPFLVHSVAFVLSASASAGITLFARPLASRLRGPQWVREPLAVSIAAQAGVTPVLLATFGRVPALTPVANLLAAPAAQALGAYGAFASATSGLVPALGPFLQTPSAALLAWVTVVARATAAVSPSLDRRSALLVLAIGGLAGASWLACGHARPGRGRDARPTTHSDTSSANPNR
jgi:competence protein ComEC